MNEVLDIQHNLNIKFFDVHRLWNSEEIIKYFNPSILFASDSTILLSFRIENEKNMMKLTHITNLEENYIYNKDSKCPVMSLSMGSGDFEDNITEDGQLKFKAGRTFIVYINNSVDNVNANIKTQIIEGIDCRLIKDHGNNDIFYTYTYTQLDPQESILCKIDLKTFKILKKYKYLSKHEKNLLIYINNDDIKIIDLYRENLIVYKNKFNEKTSKIIAHNHMSFSGNTGIY